MEHQKLSIQIRVVNLQQQFLSIVLKQKAVDSAWMAEALGVTMSLLKEYGGQ